MARREQKREDDGRYAFDGGLDVFASVGIHLACMAPAVLLIACSTACPTMNVPAT